MIVITGVHRTAADFLVSKYDFIINQTQQMVALFDYSFDNRSINA